MDARSRPLWEGRSACGRGHRLGCIRQVPLGRLRCWPSWKARWHRGEEDCRGDRVPRAQAGSRRGARSRFSRSAQETPRVDSSLQRAEDYETAVPAHLSKVAKGAAVSRRLTSRTRRPTTCPRRHEADTQRTSRARLAFGPIPQGINGLTPIGLPDLCHSECGLGGSTIGGREGRTVAESRASQVQRSYVRGGVWKAPWRPWPRANDVAPSTVSPDSTTSTPRRSSLRSASS